MALDFTSLLLSKESPNQASLAMSQVLKQLVGPATLGIDKWQRSPVSNKGDSDSASVSLGWRVEMLGEAASSLSRAAARLQGEVDREERFWQEIVHVSAGGWSIARAGTSKHELGVRFGVAEGTR